MPASTRSIRPSALTAACLSLAVARRQLVLSLQPRVDCRTRSVCGAEASLYLRHPRLGRLALQRHRPLAEQAGLAVELDHWMLDAACRQLEQCRAEGASAWTISVPLSMSTLQAPGFQGRVCSALGHSGLPASRLILCLPKSAALAGSDAHRQAFSLLGMGVQLSMGEPDETDAALAWLPSALLHEISIPRSLICALDRCVIARATVASLISEWQRAGLRVSAGGVIREEQHMLLATLGCDTAQGAFYGHLPWR
ncbi:TPA: EAL domain-containing protein [Stenotrophomonas maltophilia]